MYFCQLPATAERSGVCGCGQLGLGVVASASHHILVFFLLPYTLLVSLAIQFLGVLNLWPGYRNRHTD